MLERIIEMARADAPEYPLDPHLTQEKVATRSLYYKLRRLCAALGKESLGILTLVDDIKDSVVDVRELAATHQELVEEKLDVAFVLAGQRNSVSAVLNDPILSVLIRATRIQLGSSATKEIDA